MAGQEIAGALERAGDILRLAFERGGDGGADIGDPGLDVLARAGQAVDEFDAAAAISSTTRSPARPSAWVICSPRCSREPVTRSPAP